MEPGTSAQYAATMPPGRNMSVVPVSIIASKGLNPFFPVLSLGPIVEYFLMHQVRVF